MLTNIIFLSPMAFWGLLAIAIPIIIHLFNLRRVKRIDFSNIAFLRKVKEESSAKRKPVELLILCSRILGILMLVLAFAQPFLINKNEVSGEDSEVIIYLDNSLSTQIEGVDGGSVFNDAIRKATAIVDAYPENTNFHFIENGYNNSPVINYTKEGIKDIFTELEVVSVDRSLREIVNRISGAGISGEFYLISDFQNKYDFEEVIADTTNNYQIMSVRPEVFNNVFVDSVYLENSFSSGNLSNLLHVRLKRNFQDALDVNLKLYLGESLVSTGVINFSDENIKDYTFEVNSEMGDLSEMRIEIDDPYVTYDNTFFISANELDKISVVEIVGNLVSNYISSIYADNDLFVFNNMSYQLIDNQLVTDADFIILNEVETFSNQLINSLKTFLESGGSLFIIPGDEIPNRLTELGVITTSDTDEEMELEQPDYANPIFDDVFESTDEDIKMPKATSSFRVTNIESSILTFPNGRTFLSKVSASGQVYFLSSPLRDQFTNFGTHSLFVPVMYKLALGSSANLSNIYYYTDAGQFTFPRTTATPNAVFQLAGSDSKLTPDQRIVGDELIMEAPKGILDVGHYTLLQGETALGNLAFNISKTESDLKRPNDELFEALKNQNHIDWIEEEQLSAFEKMLASDITGKPLWVYALMLSLLFLFVEVILIRYL